MAVDRREHGRGQDQVDDADQHHRRRCRGQFAAAAVFAAPWASAVRSGELTVSARLARCEQSRSTLPIFERLAGAGKLDAGALGYFAGGAGDEMTLRDDVAAWGALAAAAEGAGRRWSEVATGGRGVGGAGLDAVLVAPVACQRLVDPEGEVGDGGAAAAAGTAMCRSTLATALPSEPVAAVPGWRRWFQLYCFEDEAVARALMDEAVDGGSRRSSVTVDAPRGGNRERDLPHRLQIPGEPGGASIAAAMGVERAVTMEETPSR